MTTKEKAKAYDEIIARAKKYLEDCPDRVDARGCIEHLIPELKESEDERIRKEIINHLISFNNGCYKIPSKDIIDNWIAWLEKQGEQKPESIVWHKVQPKEYVLEKTLIIKKNGELDMVSDTILSVTDAEYALPVSQLPKPKSNVIQGEQKPVEHLELKAGHWYICHRAYCCRADSLTVREGERFMCEKDGVVKGFVIKEPEKYFKEVCAPVPIEDEQKSVEWSEEDEMIYQHCLVILHDYGYDNWLKSFYLQKLSNMERNRKNWKPSEEQMEALRIAKVYPSSERREILETLYADLEQLKAL